MKLIIIIPCLNEEKTIQSVIKEIPSEIQNISQIETVVIDDGSTDSTAKLAKEQGAHILIHSKNEGVGVAFQTGVQYAILQKADIIVNMDGDGQFNPADISKLIEPIINHRADFVTASRFIDPALYPEMSKIKFRGNRFMSWFISKLTKQKFHDVSCGFRAYSYDTLLKLNLFGEFTYTQETFIDLALKGITIKEIPLKIKGRRDYGKSRIAFNVFTYAYKTLKIILRAYRDYKPFNLFAFFALISLSIGIAFGIFLLLFYFHHHRFTPYKWTGFTSIFFISVSLILLLIGFILDMITRIRKNQEQILYLLKKNK